MLEFYLSGIPIMVDLTSLSLYSAKAPSLQAVRSPLGAAQVISSVASVRPPTHAVEFTRGDTERPSGEQTDTSFPLFGKKEECPSLLPVACPGAMRPASVSIMDASLRFRAGNRRRVYGVTHLSLSPRKGGVSFSLVSLISERRILESLFFRPAVGPYLAGSPPLHAESILVLSSSPPFAIVSLFSFRQVAN